MNDEDLLNRKENKMMKSILCVAMASASTLLWAFDTPEVSNVQMSQEPIGRKVTITYKLSNALNGAVITLDVETNRTGTATNVDADWISIGGVAVCNAQGAVWRKVTPADADGEGWYTITWNPDLSWEGHEVPLASGGARAVVTAWALDNTPDYMVVDISAAAQRNTQRYYPGVDFLPGSVPGQQGAITNNLAYRCSMIVMRKIMAKDVVWTMGSVDEYDRNADTEATHQVSLTNNYYIGVFETTQNQWALVAASTARTAPQYFSVNGGMRPVERTSYNELRCCALGAHRSDGGHWPASPYENSFLWRLRDKTGIDFDLPSEAEWEFAARAGHGNRLWGNGNYMTSNNVSDSSLLGMARFKGNEGKNTADANTAPEDGGTAICGTYQSNKWGLYDMHGNVMELCLDWYEASITNNNGRVNIDVSTPANTLSGATGSNRVRRGGYYGAAASACRSASRGSLATGSTHLSTGFRLAYRAGLK